MTARSLRWTASKTGFTYGLFHGYEFLGSVAQTLSGDWLAALGDRFDESFGYSKTAWGCASKLLRALKEGVE